MYFIYAYGISQARGRIGAVGAGYTTDTAMWVASHICCLHHSSRQHQILNPLSEARDRTRNLMVPSQIRFRCTKTGTPSPLFIYYYYYYYYYYYLLFRAASVAYGGSQARGPIGAVATTYTTVTAMPDPSHVYDLHHSPRQHQILNPLSKARDRTFALTDTSQIHFH